MHISSLKIVIPGTKSYLVQFSFKDFIPHSIASLGTLKSGSPILRLITSTPDFFISFTLELIPIVQEGEILSSLFDNINNIPPFKKLYITYGIWKKYKIVWNKKIF